jgi:hypothetical protein
MDGFGRNEAAPADFDRLQLTAEDVRVEFASTETEHLGDFFNF